MFKLTISWRIYMLVAVFLAALAGMAYLNIQDAANTRLGDRTRELRSLTDAGVAIAQAQYARFEAGEIDEQTAKKSALSIIESLRYRGSEYLFVLALDRTMLMHPLLPKMNGTRTEPEAGKQDITGQMIAITKADGQGTLKYEVVLKEGEPPVGRTTYFQQFQKWGWIVATGARTADLAAENQTSTLYQAGIAAAISLLAVIVAWFISRGITKPLARLNATMKHISDGAFDVEIPGLARKDELGAMARTVEVFRENGLKITQMTEAEAARIIASQAERTRMMTELQGAFGNVVEAAIGGDFSQRVPTRFPDKELNLLASSVNTLVETVDQGLGATSVVLSAMAETNLTQRMVGNFRGAFAQLQRYTNAVADNFSDIVAQLRETSRGLKVATGEILSGANDLSERTTKQAATVEETSAAMEQLAVTVMENAKRAEEASRNAEQVSHSAEQGGAVMTEANGAMERITSSSSKISNIIGLIDDIAFQTNLLALNASVEAARAGDAGKGFAVVAVEVRRLAQSAASASSEVKVLIEQSAREVMSGTQLVADASQKLSAMLVSVRENSTLLTGIARASREQASAIEEVNGAVRQMDEMTQHNAALVEQTNAAIDQTESQATELDRIVDIFNIAEAQKLRRAA